MEENKELLKEILSSFGVCVEVVNATAGNAVTMYEVKPTLGTRVSKIRNLKDDIAVGMGVQNVRIIAPMENGMVGIEVPNKERRIVPMSEILQTQEYDNCDMELPCAFGKTSAGMPFIRDLALMPHMLIAGATGQGKSVGLNMILMSLLRKKSPDEMRLVLIDPKRVELSVYSALEDSYLAVPVITEADEAMEKLESLCNLMEYRYSLLCDKGVRNIMEYNKSAEKKIPYIVVVIDEYGDLIISGGRKVEKAICRIAQKARAVGIHMIISTQRPSATIVTGDIKANFPTRVAFRTTTGTDSRVILDQMGAERLTGKGDMIFYNGAETVRAQCALVTDSDIHEVMDDLCYKYYWDKFDDVMDIPQPKDEISEELAELMVKAADLASRVDYIDTYRLWSALKIETPLARLVIEKISEKGWVMKVDKATAIMTPEMKKKWREEYAS